jgi:hypothetical protein
MVVDYKDYYKIGDFYISPRYGVLVSGGYANQMLF